MSQLNANAPFKDPELSAELFKSLPALGAESEKITRPVLTYWQDAIKRIKRNRLAMVSFWWIVFIGTSGVVGPWFFPKTLGGESFENSQNHDNINQEPHGGHKVLAMDDNWMPPAELIKEGFNTSAPLLKGDALVAPSELKVEGVATVNGVTLVWEPVEGVSGYKIYRNVTTVTDSSELDAAKAEVDARGVQVGVVTNPAQYSLSDASGLDASEKYLYSIVSYVDDSESGEQIASSMAAVTATDIKKSIRLSEALNISSDAKTGEMVKTRASIFGSDNLGRDIFARMLVGTRVDFFLALFIPTLTLIIGILYGATSGLVGGKLDLVLMRIIEILDSMPELLFLILFQVVLGKGVWSLVIALSAFGWTGYARLLRGEVLRLREIEFVHASKLLGANLFHLIVRHIAPNLLGLILVVWTSQIPRMITAEAFLSLLGLGLESPAASWGTVLQDAGQQFQNHPLQFFLPASIMASTLLAFFLLGDAMRDAFDPKMRGRE